MFIPYVLQANPYLFRETNSYLLRPTKQDAYYIPRQIFIFYAVRGRCLFLASAQWTLISAHTPRGGHLLLRSTRWTFIYHVREWMLINALSRMVNPYDPRGGCLVLMSLETDLLFILQRRYLFTMSH